MGNKKIMLSIVGIAILVVGLVGVTFAFFNYTRTGSANTLAVGRIYFNSTQGNSINLSNVFPVKSTELENNSNVGSVTLTITGDTTYDDGIEYLLTVANLTNKVNDKEVPISVEVSGSNIGTPDSDYFDNRGGNTSIYKVLVDGVIKNNKELLVGYITKGATGVNGTITIKAYIDKDNIAISDTYNGEESDNMRTTIDWVDGRTVLTTEEWNSLQDQALSFKVKVEANEGVWVEELSAYNLLRKSADITTLIDFSKNSSSTNGEGLYVLPGTQNDDYPIYYYRGNIDNNNVVFGGICWQIVRTTDTGGIKMIYNGEPIVSGSDNNITYDCGTTRPVKKMGEVLWDNLYLYQPSGYYYADGYEIVEVSGTNVTYRLKSEVNPITRVPINNSNAATAISTIADNYPYTCKNTTADGTCTFLFKIKNQSHDTMANAYTTSAWISIGNSIFDSKKSSLNVGYMSNELFETKSGLAESGSIFGKNIEWNGTDYLVIDDNVNVASTNETLDAFHHYTCGVSGVSRCDTVRYYYYNFSTHQYYITLSNGDFIDDALYKMTGNGSDETKIKNNGYKLNVNDSNIKSSIENWFKIHLTNEIDTNNLNYSSYLEDTIFCNDRSLKTIGSSGIYNLSGWNPSGGDQTVVFRFGTSNRYSNGWYSTTNVPAIKNTGVVPSVACPNEIDRFSVSSNVAHLNYPVGLLTADEIVMAGASGNGNSNYDYYLWNGFDYWAMSPLTSNSSSSISVLNSTGLITAYSANSNVETRPVVSLKHGTEFELDGDGTSTNPYVVKYN